MRGRATLANTPLAGEADAPLLGRAGARPPVFARRVVAPAAALSGLAAFVAGSLWASGSGSGALRSWSRLAAEGPHMPTSERFRTNLVFSDDFDVFDVSRWKHEITMSAGGNWEFQWYTNNRTNTFVQDGVLHFHPTLTTEQFGEDFLSEGGALDIWGTTPSSQCTSNAFWGCFREAGEGGNVLPPVQSAKVRTFESFSFKYGRMEVRARMPRGDWLWPAIWLLPKHEMYGGWPASGEIDAFEARGNANKTSGPNQIGSTLHWGPSGQENPWDMHHAEYVLPDGTDFADDYHIFGLYWDEDELYTYIDTDENRVLVAQMNESFWSKGMRQRPHWQGAYKNPWAAAGNANAPYDQEFYIVMNLAVGGTNGYFNKTLLENMPWHQGEKTDIARHAVNHFWAARDEWHPTWKGDDSDMRVDWVKVWQDAPDK
mmetsp:Transcript_13675/g.32497  ORF Transcript_13675/g.32497 Transcript_13675/m.32497 type:complete len:429 (-) Transcript_13675:147-1433(-)